MSKKIGKREARNKLFEAVAHEVENSTVGAVDLNDRDAAVVNGERANVAARIRKLIAVKKDAEPEEQPADSASPGDELF